MAPRKTIDCPCGRRVRLESLHRGAKCPKCGRLLPERHELPDHRPGKGAKP